MNKDWEYTVKAGMTSHSYQDPETGEEKGSHDFLENTYTVVLTARDFQRKYQPIRTFIRVSDEILDRPDIINKSIMFMFDEVDEYIKNGKHLEKGRS